MSLLFLSFIWIWLTCLQVDRDGRSCLHDNGGTTLLASHDIVYGPGGQGVFTDKQRGLTLYYHYANKNVGLDKSQFRLIFDN